MMIQHNVARAALAALLAGMILAIASTPAAWGCLAEYRSPEWQVARSPLIVIAEVEKVEQMKGEPPLGGVLPSDDLPAPVATVRIVRILKGRCAARRLRARCGPIRSCSPFAEYYTPEAGQSWLFLIPRFTRDGEAQLTWNHSLLPLSKTAFIESCIARAATYRATWLDRLEMEKPRTHAAAIELARMMRDSSRNWPLDPADKDIAGILDRLSKVDLETIVAAQAVDWLSTEHAPWWLHGAWWMALRELPGTREQEAAAYRAAWIERTLADAGVEAKQIEAYISYVRQSSDRIDLSFPPSAPYLANDLLDRPSSQVLTTDFILHYHAYDRGGMVTAYAGSFSGEILQGLEVARVRPLIASLYGSDNERLRWLAREAIAHMPGHDCVDLVLDDLVASNPWAWQALQNRKSPQRTALHLAAMIDLGSKQYGVWRQVEMWRMLRRGDCFEDVCIEKALAALAELEQAEAAAGKADDAKDDASSGVAERAAKEIAIREYLEAAKARREGGAPPIVKAEAYRKWFADHRAKEENP